VKRRWGLAALAWVVAAVLTTVIGIAAVESLGNGILGSPEQPLTRGDVASQLAASPGHSGGTGSEAPSPSELPSASSTPDEPPSPTPTLAPTLAPTPPTSTRVFTIAGGTVVASCRGGLVTLQSWSPAQGYHVVRVERGPARSVEIRFGSGKGDEGHGSRLTVSCRDGRPEGADDD
jgi:hypothetical protein